MVLSLTAVACFCGMGFVAFCRFVFLWRTRVGCCSAVLRSSPHSDPLWWSRWKMRYAPLPRTFLVGNWRRTRVHGDPVKERNIPCLHGEESVKLIHQIRSFRGFVTNASFHLPQTDAASAWLWHIVRKIGSLKKYLLFCRACGPLSLRCCGG